MVSSKLVAGEPPVNWWRRTFTMCGWGCENTNLMRLLKIRNCLLEIKELDELSLTQSLPVHSSMALVGIVRRP